MVFTERAANWSHEVVPLMPSLQTAPSVIVWYMLLMIPAIPHFAIFIPPQGLWPLPCPTQELTQVIFAVNLWSVIAPCRKTPIIGIPTGCPWRACEDYATCLRIGDVVLVPRARIKCSWLLSIQDCQHRSSHTRHTKRFSLSFGRICWYQE